MALANTRNGTALGPAAASMVYLWAAPCPEINHGYVYLAPIRVASAHSLAVYGINTRIMTSEISYRQHAANAPFSTWMWSSQGPTKRRSGGLRWGGEPAEVSQTVHPANEHAVQLPMAGGYQDGTMRRRDCGPPASPFPMPGKCGRGSPTSTRTPVWCRYCWGSWMAGMRDGHGKTGSSAPGRPGGWWSACRHRAYSAPAAEEIEEDPECTKMVRPPRAVPRPAGVAAQLREPVSCLP